MNEGHLTRFGYSIRKNKKLNNSITHLTVDESQNIASSGMPGPNGEAPHRPNYGKLDLFRTLLPKRSSVSSVSATINPFIRRIIDSKLAMRANKVRFVGTLNRINVCYASRDIVDSINNHKNLKFLIPIPYPPGLVINRTMVFVDTQAISNAASRYTNSRFPLEMQNLKIAKHYHSGMSSRYLQETYDSFVSDSDPCSILFATKGAATVSD